MIYDVMSIKMHLTVDDIFRRQTLKMFFGSFMIAHLEDHLSNNDI